LDKLRSLAKSFLFFEEYGRTRGCPTLNTAVDSEDAPPQLLQEVRQALTALERYIDKLVNLGKRAGEIRFDSDARAANFIALVEGGILLPKTLGDRKYL
jgi:hypothetical protein